MADYIDNGLLAMERSLAEVVLPSVDPADPLAREQLLLAIDYLRFVRSRLDFLAARARFDLRHYRGMAEAVVVAAPAALTEQLSTVLDGTAMIGGGVEETPATLREASERLANAVDDVVGACAAKDEATRRIVERIVLDASKQWIDLEMSWYGPIAVDEDGRGLLPIKTFFSVRQHGSTAA